MKLDNKQAQLKSTLENLYACRSTRHLQNDPLSFCHRYNNSMDQEIVGLIAASFAYGKVNSIKQSVEKILAILTPTPHDFIASYEPASSMDLLPGFKHRFNNQQDLLAIFWAIKTMIAQAGSIGNYFLRFYDSKADDITSALIGFTSAVLKMDYSPIYGSQGIPADSYFPFLFPSPASGSACKRLCMYLRWMVRPADGFDLGLWQLIPPRKLVIPVDAHIQRIARFLGLTSRNQADWRMAQEITAALTAFDAEDPVKYDFSLCHIGISEGCRGQQREACLTCDLAALCGDKPQ
ncbi:MAG: TIGR02757 family protein [Deltaproteobacteria bacterium]|nr:TIGR02757 family protein [Deltaproteobacteria bacterium]TLN03648.1 MAG: TIGR02757 family protein [bacterium]